MSELARLRASIDALQSYELSQKYDLPDDTRTSSNDNLCGDRSDNGGGSSSTDTSPIFFDTALLKRYKDARDSYIRNQTIEMFVQMLETYDADTGTFSLPSPISDEERQQQKLKQHQILQEIRGTIENVNNKISDVKTKFEKFCHSREELTTIVERMEQAARQDKLNGNDDMNDDSEDEDISEEEVAAQEEKLKELKRRKAELEGKLQTAKVHILDVEDECHRAKKAVNEMRVSSGRKPLCWKNSSIQSAQLSESEALNCDEELELIDLSREVDSEIAEIEEKTEDLRKSAEFYEGIRELMEELGGVKILSTKSMIMDASIKAGEGSNSKRQKLSPDTSNEKDSKITDEGYVLTLMLLGSHILEIVLGRAQVPQRTSQVNKRIITSAKLVTTTVFPIDSGRHVKEALPEDETKKSAVSVTLPAIDDLVQWSHSLDLSRGIRFVIVETLARIRSLDARVTELNQLREKYTAKVYDAESPANNFGGAEQEVVCCLNEGITVALRLGADCPLAHGSVYISEIFGIGWNHDVLKKIKETINNMRCKGPIEVMDELVNEVERLKRDGGLHIPSTPSLPKKS